MSLAGLEPATDGVETRHSVQLSYSDKVWSRRVGLNHRPAVYKAAALTTELRLMELMVLAAGVEPAWVRLPFRQFRKLRGYASIEVMEPEEGVEPSPSVYRTVARPMSYSGKLVFALIFLSFNFALQEVALFLFHSMHSSHLQPKA